MISISPSAVRSIRSSSRLRTQKFEELIVGPVHAFGHVEDPGSNLCLFEKRVHRIRDTTIFNPILAIASLRDNHAVGRIAMMSQKVRPAGLHIGRRPDVSPLGLS